MNVSPPFFYVKVRSSPILETPGKLLEPLAMGRLARDYEPNRKKKSPVHAPSIHPSMVEH